MDEDNLKATSRFVFLGIEKSSTHTRIRIYIRRLISQSFGWINKINSTGEDHYQKLQTVIKTKPNFPPNKSNIGIQTSQAEADTRMKKIQMKQKLER